MKTTFKQGPQFRSSRGRKKVCSIEQIATAKAQYEFNINHPQEKIIAPVEKSMRGVTLNEVENTRAVHRANAELVRETIRTRKREVYRTLQPKLYQRQDQEAIIEILVPRLTIDLSPKKPNECSPSKEVEEIIAEAQTRFEDNGDGRRGGRNRAAMALGISINEGEKVLVRG